MKRSELYALVWTKSLVKVARELGISDVGLAKACRRHDIPTPPRGHWIKLEFDKQFTQIPLPPRDDDEDIVLRPMEPQQKARKDKERVEAKVIATKVEELIDQPCFIPESLVKPHPLVRATATYLTRLPKIISRYERRVSSSWYDYKDYELPAPEHNGRRLFNVPDGLIVTASLDSMDWVLRFYEGLFCALKPHKVSAKRVESDRRNGPEKTKIFLELGAEQLSIFFQEGYRRYDLDPKEFKALQKKESWAKSWRFVASGKLTFTVTGTEHSISKEWRGTANQLEASFPEIVANSVALLQRQPEVRAERLHRETIQRLEAQEKEKQREIKSARAAQLKNALAASDEYEKVERLKSFLQMLDKEALTWNEPYAERAKVWISVVREELKESDPYLAMMGKFLSPDPWRVWPPRWWPEKAE